MLKKLRDTPTPLEIPIENPRDSASTPQFKEENSKAWPEISKLTSLSNSSLNESKNLLYSDSSLIDTKDKNIHDKIKFDILIDASENLKERLENSVEQLTNKIESLNIIIKRQDKAIEWIEEKVKENIENNKGKEKEFNELNKKIIGKDKEIEELNLIYENKFSEIYKIINQNIKNSGQNHKTQKKLVINTENNDMFADIFKEIDLKIEKNQYYCKSQMKNLLNSFIKKSDLEEFLIKIDELSKQSNKCIDEIKFLKEKIEKDEEDKNIYNKNHQILYKSIIDHEKSFKELELKCLLNDEKLENTIKLREIIKTRDEELYKKISEIDCQILELQESSKNEEIKTEFIKFNLKLNKNEEIIKNINAIDEKLNQFHYNIQDLIRKHTVLEEEIRKVSKIQQELSLEVSEQEIEQEKFVYPHQEKFEFSKMLSSRLEKLEKINIHKKALEIQKNVDDIGNFIPGETENLVRSAVLEKVNNYNKGLNFNFGYRNLCPISPGYTFTSYEEELQPSVELQENLKTRGISLNNSRS